MWIIPRHVNERLLHADFEARKVIFRELDRTPCMVIKRDNGH